MVVGVLQLEVHLPNAHSLKDKRSVINSLKDQLRGRFNIAVAQIGPNEKWQRATVAVAAVGEDRSTVQAALNHVASWVRSTPLVTLVHIEEEYV